MFRKCRGLAAAPWTPCSPDDDMMLLLLATSSVVFGRGSALSAHFSSGEPAWRPRDESRWGTDAFTSQTIMFCTSRT